MYRYCKRAAHGYIRVTYDTHPWQPCTDGQVPTSITSSSACLLCTCHAVSTGLMTAAPQRCFLCCPFPSRLLSKPEEGPLPLFLPPLASPSTYLPTYIPTYLPSMQVLLGISSRARIRRNTFRNLCLSFLFAASLVHPHPYLPGRLSSRFISPMPLQHQQQS
ncbi:hypothetical protein LZ31DRAFT_22042 [Colletotrichum somersetense]|nr:hypothetical protein LZ31DRAFT_22042 [Colletotrichum somersetense]